MERHWARIWQQAMTQSFLNGRAFGKNKTIVFSVLSPAGGDRLRVRFSNRYGKAPSEIGALTLRIGKSLHHVTLNGKETFCVPIGAECVSDELAVSISAGEPIELRLYYTNCILDNNMIEEGATLLKGDHTKDAVISEQVQKPYLAMLLGAYNGIPAIEAVELYTAAPARAIVAFGDSITALSRWTKPLAKRLSDAYGGDYVLLNAGISGNCLLCERPGLFGPVYGRRGTVRFSDDVLAVPRLDAVILGLGVNDASYLSEKTKDTINDQAYIAAITDLTEQLHARGVRVIMQTITPRLGCAKYLGTFTPEMERLRLAWNAWIRSAGIFDYVFDAEAVVAEAHPDGLYYREGWHQGDHLHPNETGGKTLADSFDLNQLTGRKQA